MSLARDVTTAGSATLASRLLGFARDMGIAALLGAGVASDALFAALQIPNLARRLLADGALNAAFVPAWLRIRDADGDAAAWRFTRQAAGAALLVLGAAMAIGLIFAPIAIRLIAPGFEPGDPRHGLAAEYFRLVLPYVGIAGLVAVLAGALNADGRVGAVSAGVVIFNGAMLAMLLIIAAAAPAYPSTVGAWLAHAFVLAGVAQLAVTGWAAWTLMHRAGRAEPRPPGEVRGFFARAMPGLIAAGVPQLTLIAGAMIASASPNAVSWLHYANRLYELPLGVVTAATAMVLVPRMAASLRAGTTGDAGAAQSRAVEIALGLSLPAAAGLAFLATPIVAVLFERGAFGADDTAAVAAALIAISAGLPGHALEKVLGAVSFARDDTRTPMFTASVGLATAVAAALALYPSYGHVGVAAGIAAGAWTGAFALAAVLGRRGWLHLDRDARRRLPRIFLATAAMSAVLLVPQTLTAWPPSALVRAAALALTIAAGLAIYLALLQAFGVARIADLVAAARKRV